MLKDNEISVVVCGAVNPTNTKKCLKSIRKFLPKSEIILSTWEGTDVSFLEGLYDTLVLNKDPLATIFDDYRNKPNNLNRIIISSQNGIEKVSRKYILKLRSDLILRNSNCLKLVDNFDNRNKTSLFENRIFSYMLFSKKYDTVKNTKLKLLFHISDWCYLGLSKDIKELFNIPTVEEPQFSRYFETNPKPFNDIHEFRKWKMSPEQYITSKNAQKVFPQLTFNNYLDLTENNIKISEDFIINNFRIFTAEEWGIKILKQEYTNICTQTLNPLDYYSKWIQIEDYNKYCNGNLSNRGYLILKSLYSIKYFENVQKHIVQIFTIKWNKKIGEIISAIYYLIKFTPNLIRSLLWIK